MYKVLLCLRMLRKRRITWLCIVGVTLGLGTLIVVNSVMNGFATEVRTRIKGTLADMSIFVGQGGFERYVAVPVGDGLDSPQAVRVDILDVVREVDGVVACSPVLEGLALIRLPNPALGQDFTRWCYFWGIDPEAEAKVSRFAEWCAGGSDGDAAHFRIDGEDVELPLVIGQELATARMRGEEGAKPKPKLLKDTGDTVILSTVAFSRSSGVTSYDQFTMVGTWKSGMAELDSQMAFISLSAAQALRRMPGRITKIHVRIEEGIDSEIMKGRLRNALEPAFGRFIITSWREERTTLLRAVALEQNLMVILLFLIIVVAGFMIMALLNMIVAEKMRDIGVIRSLGGSRRGVAWIFLSFGVAIGAVGCLLGTTAGLLFTDNISAIEDFIADVTGRQVFPREIYYFDKIPTVVDLVSILWFNAGVLAVCLVSSVWPAWRASTRDPVEAIRYE